MSLHKDIKIVADKISLTELKLLASQWYDDMIKGTVDIEQEILALGGEYHMDANMALIGKGSKQNDIWGFNLRLEKPRESWVEFTSLINIRPAQGNRGMLIEDQVLQERMKLIINKRIV